MFTLSLEDIRLLKVLSDQMGELPSQIVKRALQFFAHDRVGTEPKQ